MSQGQKQDEINEASGGSGLAQSTLDFWNLSSIRNGRIERRLTTAGAIIILRDLRYGLGPHRVSLLRSLDALEHDIIYNDPACTVGAVAQSQSAKVGIAEVTVIPLIGKEKNHAPRG